MVSYGLYQHKLENNDVGPRLQAWLQKGTVANQLLQITFGLLESSHATINNSGASIQKPTTPTTINSGACIQIPSQATRGAKRLQAEELPTPAKRAQIEQLPSPIGSTSTEIENGESWNPSAENLDISLDLLLNSANNWARTPETILQPVAIYESLSHH